MKLFTRRFRENLLVTSALVVLMSVCSASGIASLLDARFSDLLFLPRTPRADIVVVAIDDASIHAIGQWPWNREVHAQLIAKLRESGARVIGYDVNFPEVSSHGSADDDALANELAKSSVVLPVELELSRVDGGWIGERPLLPIPAFVQHAGIGSANVPRDGDGVARTVPLSVMTGSIAYPSFAFSLLPESAQQHPTPDIRINFVGPPGTFTRYSAVDVIQGRVSAAAFQGKTVLVGATAPDLHDDLVVPTSRGLPMPGVEVHANILDTLLSDNALHALPKPYGVALVVLYGLFVGIVITRSKLRYGTFSAVGLMIAHVIAAIVAFEKNLILPIVWPLLSCIVVYVAIVAVRYFHEQRERQKLRMTLDQYLSPSVVADLLAHPDKFKLGGERRTMTVLFSDLRGFTTLSEGLSPEMLVTVLNHYLDVMTEKVFATNGVVDKYMGDAIMAFWGASFLDTDHTDRAIMTAILMRSTLNEMNASKSWPNGVQLNLGIGVNTGEMVVGNMGSSKRFDYTVMGDAVNLGSRIEGLNKEYGTQIIVSEFARRSATPGKFVYRTLDMVAVKGKKEPVEIFEVVGLSSEAKRDGVEAFEKAIGLYRAQSFAEAREIFLELAEKGDYASKMYIERCDAFIAHPPVGDWNGVWVYTKK